MKGLLIKDMKLMKNQKQFLVVMIFFGVLFMFVYSSPFSVICYLTIMFSMLVTTTLTYDEFENGGAYLFTLPFSRRDYVKEKYLFGIAVICVSCTAASVLAVIASNIRGIEYELGELGIVSLSSIIASICFISLALPIEIKLGVEKGRIGFLLVMAAFFLFFYLLMKVTERHGSGNILAWLDMVIEHKLPIAIVGLCIFLAVLLGISMLLSMKFISKKEY